MHYVSEYVQPEDRFDGSDDEGMILESSRGAPRLKKQRMGGDEGIIFFNHVEFAKAILNHAETNNLITPSKINLIATSAYPTPAKRPAFSVLDCSRIGNHFGVRASNWHRGIEQAISKLKV